MLITEKETKSKQVILNNIMFNDINMIDLQGELRKEEPMSRHTSWKTGGNADYYYIASDLNDLTKFISKLPDSIPITWVGLGSNLLDVSYIRILSTAPLSSE